MTTVSILTITQYSRRETFQLLVQMVEKQTMQATEWVIVEGSPTKDYEELNGNLIQKWADEKPELNIVYVDNPKEKQRTFANMLNTGNSVCKGQIIVQMEDDDYYPPTRIQHAVEMLNNSRMLIAGCSSVYFYDYNTSMISRTPYFGDAHSANHALAYKRRYLKEHKYKHNREKGFSIEESFLRWNSVSKIIQLEPEHTILYNVYNGNTIPKEDIVKAWIKGNRLLPVDTEKCKELYREYKENYLPHYTEMFKRIEQEQKRSDQISILGEECSIDETEIIQLS
jgi:glycosyltransferase involved in cell wall biosynthesis